MFENSDNFSVDDIVAAHAAPQAGPAPAQASAPVPDQSLPAGDPLVQQPAPAATDAGGGFVWPEFPDEEQPADRFAAYQADDALNTWQLPPEALAAWKQDREFVRALKDESSALTTLRQSFEPLGGEAAAPLAVDLTGRLFGAIAPDEATAQKLTQQFGGVQNAPIPQLAFLDSVRQMNGNIYQDLVDAAVMHDFDRVMGSLREEVLRREGLSAELMESYRAVTVAGGYTPQADVAEVQAFLNGQPKELHGTFNRLPRDIQQSLMDDRPETARFHLENYARNYARDDRDKQMEVEQRQQAVQQEEARYQTEVQTITKTYFDQYIAKGEGLKFDRLQAVGLAFETQQKLQEMAGTDPRLQQLDRELTRAIQTRNQPLRDKVMREYDQIVDRVWRQTINANNPQRSRLSGAQQQVSAGAAPPATAAHFTPANPSGGERSTDDVLADLVRSYSRA